MVCIPLFHDAIECRDAADMQWHTIRRHWQRLAEHDKPPAGEVPDRRSRAMDIYSDLDSFYLEIETLGDCVAPVLRVLDMAGAAKSDQADAMRKSARQFAVATELVEAIRGGLAKDFREAGPAGFEEGWSKYRDGIERLLDAAAELHAAIRSTVDQYAAADSCATVPLIDVYGAAA